MLDYGEYITDIYYSQDNGNGNGYDQLDGDWALFYKVARYFVHKVKFEDREDFLHDLLLEMAKVKAKYKAKGKPLSEAGLMRVASYEVTEYWHTLVRHRPTVLSLNDKTDNGDGEATELIEFLADDKAVDLDLKLDARRFLLGCPLRLIQIAHKRQEGELLTAKDKMYLSRYRWQEQKSLF